MEGKRSIFLLGSDFPTLIKKRSNFTARPSREQQEAENDVPHTQMTVNRISKERVLS
jgi:hypothetical protein